MAEREFIDIGTRAKDATGEKYGKLTVLGAVGRDDGRRIQWLAVCECGGECVDQIHNLRRNTSCGCHKATRMGRLTLRHGHFRDRQRAATYHSWQSMIARCENPNHENFAYYGGRGIEVCPRWRASFEDFLADMGERPPGRTIDRQDVNGNYEPSNCRWATAVEQRANQRRK
ncbi:hypothetical protein LPC10_01630 [Methylorubrum sp. B1-46]|uniref:hypothetical protein n=1 Tax=Methylorubrum sp. B1-46 TaxID=2897334 RepID=UPI001E2CF5E3|nr:hypothetical protein [Methylorubrum sp. B1-46]UGB26341.1 hypothetical protein LPC10_01630 [Methylorubrum sp. B1-46]